MRFGRFDFLDLLYEGDLSAGDELECSVSAILHCFCSHWMGFAGGELSLCAVECFGSSQRSELLPKFLDECLMVFSMLVPEG